MTMENLRYSHLFASGREITLTVERSPGKRPKAKSSIQCAALTEEELAEYVPWRNNAVSSMMSLLTPEEIFAAL